MLLSYIFGNSIDMIYDKNKFGNSMYVGKIEVI